MPEKKLSDLCDPRMNLSIHGRLALAQRANQVKVYMLDGRFPARQSNSLHIVTGTGKNEGPIKEQAVNCNFD